jgi:hypothetical protein
VREGRRKAEEKVNELVDLPSPVLATPAMDLVEPKPKARTIRTDEKCLTLEIMEQGTTASHA